MSADGDAVTGRHDLGIFARTFPRSSADEVATTFVDARRTMSSSLHPVSIVMDVRLTDRE